MTDNNYPTGSLDLDSYVQTQTRLRALKSHLPENLVEDLAREVIHRLAARDTKGNLDAPPDALIEQLCHALLSDNDHAGTDFIANIRSEGASLETAYLVYLARAARMLGRWWDEDRVSFVEVTLGTSRMYAIMRMLRHQSALSHQALDKSAVFASIPGETHTLGVRMAADLFRKDGWDIDLKIGLEHDELVAAIERSQTQIIGLSAAGDHAIDGLARLVLAIQINNPAASILISGHIVDEAEDRISLMSVEGMAADFETARRIMNGFLPA